MNILHGLSKTFGESDFWEYMSLDFPLNFTLLFPFLFVATIYYHPWQC